MDITVRIIVIDEKEKDLVVIISKHGEKSEVLVGHDAHNVYKCISSALDSMKVECGDQS